MDEAHNLPEKAIAMRKTCAPINEDDWLYEVESYGERVMSIADVANRVAHVEGLGAAVYSEAPAQILRHISAIREKCLSRSDFTAAGVRNWGLKQPKEWFLEMLVRLNAPVQLLLSALNKTAQTLSDRAEDVIGAEKALCIGLLTETYKFIGQVERLYKGLDNFVSADGRIVRWMRRTKDGSLTLHAQPLEGADVLNDLMWGGERSIVLVSATLQVAGSFDRFASKSGLPAHAVTKALPAVFDYKRVLLHQPMLSMEPGAPGFESAVVHQIESLYARNVAKGTLVLFTSRDMMQRVCGALSGPARSALLMQGNASVPELVAQHKARIDSGERSILAGLASMSEGLDLPGDYCGHVILTKLPFAVPDDPIELARQDLLGDRWFMDAYLADMLTTLIQSCGRLLRREADKGVVTILDRRLVTRRYGPHAIDALPFSFERRTTNIDEYFSTVIPYCEASDATMTSTRIVDKLMRETRPSRSVTGLTAIKARVLVPECGAPSVECLPTLRAKPQAGSGATKRKLEISPELRARLIGMLRAEKATPAERAPQMAASSEGAVRSALPDAKLLTPSEPKAGREATQSVCTGLPDWVFDSAVSINGADNPF